jgi:hypothetical protein
VQRVSDVYRGVAVPVLNPEDVYRVHCFARVSPQSRRKGALVLEALDWTTVRRVLESTSHHALVWKSSKP